MTFMTHNVTSAPSIDALQKDYSTCDLVCNFVFGAPGQLRLLAAQEHGRIIPIREAD